MGRGVLPGATFLIDTIEEIPVRPKIIWTLPLLVCVSVLLSLAPWLAGDHIVQPVHNVVSIDQV